MYNNVMLLTLDDALETKIRISAFLEFFMQIDIMV